MYVVRQVVPKFIIHHHHWQAYLAALAISFSPITPFHSAKAIRYACDCSSMDKNSSRCFSKYHFFFPFSSLQEGVLRSFHGGSRVFFPPSITPLTVSCESIIMFFSQTLDYACVTSFIDTPINLFFGCLTLFLHLPVDNIISPRSSIKARTAFFRR